MVHVLTKNCTSMKCKKCGVEISYEAYRKNGYVCPSCGALIKMSAKERLNLLTDAGTFIEWDQNIQQRNPLDDTNYEEKLRETARKTNADEAVITGEVDILSNHVAIGIMDPNFLMASMGYYVGERICRLFERATVRKLPVVLVSCSGGARIQEGIVSLMQMEKTAAAVDRHHRSGLLYISVLTNPTMGGVTASYATLGDINIAEEGARIGFAGPRVIKQNLHIDLPDDFQSANFNLRHGFVDIVAERKELKELLGRLLKLHRPGFSVQLDYPKFSSTSEEEENQLSQWEAVRCARKKNRPTSLDFIHQMFDDFIELHGDRAVGDDRAIVGGIAFLQEYPVTVIGQQKGKKSLADALERNWGMPSPVGYRKVIRLAKQAEKFHRPIIFLVDTIGASCNVEAEEYGQGSVIAELLRTCSSLTVPTLSLIIGEGNSGGALAMASTNEVWMLENAVYSILSPEGAASIVEKDAHKAEEVANTMRMKAADMVELGVADRLFQEKGELDLHSLSNLCSRLSEEIQRFIECYQYLTKSEIVEKRYRRFRGF